MTYEIMTYNCSAGDYYVVYVQIGKNRLAILMAMDLKEVNDFLANQRNCEKIIESNYTNLGTVTVPSTCKGCE